MKLPLIVDKIKIAIDDKINGKVPKGSKRSGKWAAVRREYLQTNNRCAACGYHKKLQVHHKKPFHLYPELELDSTNLITLCDTRGSLNCHVTFGHLGYYRSYNQDVDSDAAIWRSKFSNRPHPKKLTK